MERRYIHVRQYVRQAFSRDHLRRVLFRLLPEDPEIPPYLYGGLLTIVDGVPAGIRITAEDIQKELDKRKPGQSKLDSPRKEKDRVYIFSGVMENQMSTGAPIGIVIPNNDIEDIHVGQYHDYKDMARPGHAEYTFMKKYGQFNDCVGAGRASGRETVSRVAGGAVAKLILDKYGIDAVANVWRSARKPKDSLESYMDAYGLDVETFNAQLYE